MLSDGKKRKRYDSGVDVNDLEQPEEHDHMHQVSSRYVLLLYTGPDLGQV